MDATDDKIWGLDRVKLTPGSHVSFADGACPLELASWISDEAWSDRPQSVCPIIGTFVRAWNDALPDDKRTEILLPLVPKLVGTRADRDVERRRAFMAADWLVRVNLPEWLTLAGFEDDAQRLASLEEITSLDDLTRVQSQLDTILPTVSAACARGWKNDWDTGRDAPRDDIWFDAFETTWAGPYAICRVYIRHSVWENTHTVAQNAAGAAFWGPSQAHLVLPVPELTQLAQALIEQMIVVRCNDR